jgi:ubiquinone/menaquinone biosynthesis C-methylase UbiE
MQIIDVGGGTADITKLVLDNSFEKNFYNNVVTMFDINMEMLKIGKEKLLKNGDRWEIEIQTNLITEAFYR